MNRVVKQHGFTLIELTLAMGFVAVLLIAIAMTVIQIGDIYNRGITLKDVNQAGRSITSELQRSIAGTTPFDADPGAGSHYISMKTKSTILTSYIKQDPVGGRLCLGQYSYIWNYGKALDDAAKMHDNSSLNAYASPNNGLQIRFVKVSDPGATYCADASKEIVFSDATELLDVGQHDLVIHNFKISTADSAFDATTEQRLYSIEFLLGTNNQSALTTDPDTEVIICRPPSDPLADPSYCSVVQFDIVARAGNAAK